MDLGRNLCLGGMMSSVSAHASWTFCPSGKIKYLLGYFRLTAHSLYCCTEQGAGQLYLHQCVHLRIIPVKHTPNSCHARNRDVWQQIKTIPQSKTRALIASLPQLKKLKPKLIHVLNLLCLCRWKLQMAGCPSACGQPWHLVSAACDTLILEVIFKLIP